MLPADRVLLELGVEVDLSRGALGDPITLAPSAWFGITDRFTLGVIHGNASVDRIVAGSGLCVHGDDCDRYSGLGFEARYLATRGFAPRARLLARDFDPGKPAITLGALARRAWGRFVVTTDPYLRLGLGNRDRGNRAALNVPLWLGVQTRRLTVELRTGYESDLEVASDGYHIPVGLRLTARVARAWEATVEVGFASLLGPQTDYRERAALFALRWSP